MNEKGDTFDAWDVIYHVINDACRINKLRGLDERTLWNKVGGIVIAACRETKQKLSEAEKRFAEYRIFKYVKELA